MRFVRLFCLAVAGCCISFWGFGASLSRADMVIKAAVAGNVADSDRNGFGDNHNPLPGGAPLLMSAAINESGGDGSRGTVRMQMEWDISGLTPGQVSAAFIVLHTVKGTVDSLDTFFYHGTGEQDGVLSDRDFESPAEIVNGARMVVRGTTGQSGLFQLDVTEQLRADLAAGRHFFSLQGRVDEKRSATEYLRGLQVCTTARRCLIEEWQPRLKIVTSYTPGRYNYYLPLYSTVAGAWTGLGLANRDRDLPTSFMVEVFSPRGDRLDAISGILPKRGQDAFPVAKGLDLTGWVKVNSSRPLSGLAFVGRLQEPAVMADIPFVSEPQKCLLIPHAVVDKNWNTQVCICNPQAEETWVRLEFVNRAGNSRGQKLKHLPPRGSGIFSLRELFPELGQMEGRIEIRTERSDQKVAAFAIYHDLDGGGSYFAGISADACGEETALDGGSGTDNPVGGAE